MIIALSLALSYVLMGFGFVTDAMNADPLKKPFWAFEPTIGKMILYGTTWPASPIWNAHFGAPDNSTRAAAFAMLDVVLRFATLFLPTWCFIQLAIYWTNNFYLQIGLVVGFLALLRFIMPVISILLVPIALILSLPLDLLFPIKKRDRP
jgi:hypothetical protein